MIKIILVLILSSTFTSQIFSQGKSNIEKVRLNFEPAYLDEDPDETVTSWEIPFAAENRFKLASIKVISVFGAPRDSYLKGHLHTAIDIIPAKSQEFNYIYPMANGIVCSIHLGHPHKTIVIKHRLPDSSIVYTSYKHLQEIYIKTGMEVNQETKLARLYTNAEAKEHGGSYDHLHLEIRKSFYDYGCASWLTMDKDELNKYFYDPLEFLKKNLGEIN